MKTEIEIKSMSRAKLWGHPPRYAYGIWQTGFFPIDNCDFQRFDRRLLEAGGTFDTPEEAEKIAQWRLKTLT